MIAVDETVTKLLLSHQAAAVLGEIDSFFAGQGIRAYIVGGFLRDLLLKRKTADIDIAIAADALEIAPDLAAALGGSYVPLDRENKVARVVPGTKGARRASRWQLDLSSFSGGIELDLKRRDFTINAMAVDLKGARHRPQQKPQAEVKIIDPFNGLADLEGGIIRATSKTVFQQDPARLLRAVRLAAELGFTIDTGTEALIKSNCHLIAGVAAERSREELLRLLEITGADKLWPYIDGLGLLTALIPELAETRGVEQPREHAWDVLNHSLKTVAAIDFVLRRGRWPYAAEEVLGFVPWSEKLARHFEKIVSGSTRRALTKMAALLHDIAKPKTRVLTESGRIRFLGHAGEGAAMAAQVLERLRFSNREAKLVEAIIRHHLRPVQMSSPGELPSQRAIYRYFRDCGSGDGGIETLFFSLADHLATRGANLDLTHWKEHTRLVDYALSQHLKQEKRVAPARLINGHDLMRLFSLKPGPRVGEILEAVREAQASAEISNREEALALIAELLNLPRDGN